MLCSMFIAFGNDVSLAPLFITNGEFARGGGFITVIFATLF